MMEEVQIQLSKSKLTLMALGSLTFVTIGLYFVINPSRFISPIHRSVTYIFAGGLSAIIIFSFVGVYIFKKLLDKKPGLIISNEGIIDNSSSLSAGFVPWSDIIKIKEMIIANQKFICLIVKNPSDYFDRQPNRIKRWLVEKNYKSFGAAIGISANGLKCNYDELKLLIQKKFVENKSKYIN